MNEQDEKENHDVRRAVLTATLTVSAQIIKPEDLEKYAKGRYGDSWLTAAANLSKQITFDKNDRRLFGEQTAAFEESAESTLSSRRCGAGR